MTREERIRWAEEHMGDVVDDGQHVGVIGAYETFSGHPVLGVETGALIKGSNYESPYTRLFEDARHGYLIFDLDRVKIVSRSSARPKWQRLGVTRGLEKLDAVRASVLAGVQ